MFSSSALCPSLPLLPLFEHSSWNTIFRLRWTCYCNLRSCSAIENKEPVFSKFMVCSRCLGHQPSEFKVGKSPSFLAARTYVNSWRGNVVCVYCISSVQHLYPLSSQPITHVRHNQLQSATTCQVDYSKRQRLQWEERYYVTHQLNDSKLSACVLYVSVLCPWESKCVWKWHVRDLNIHKHKAVSRQIHKRW